MRLICPNCGAQYEVPLDAIPDEGRDVQCSNCSHTWFERPGDSARLEAAGEPPPAGAPPPRRPLAQERDAKPGPQSAAAAAAPRPAPQDDAPEDDYADLDLPGIAEAASEEEDRQAGEAPPAPAPPPVAPVRTAVAPEIAAILREEAQREQAQRQAERGRGFDAQDEMALPPGRRNDERRGGRMRNETTTARELLPDIEELNSSLRSEAAVKAAAALAEEDREDAEARSRRGFRRGFSLVLLVLAVLALVYSYAPQIADKLPASRGALAAYVDKVDAGRLWLDLKLQALTTRLQDASGADTGSPAEQ